MPCISACESDTKPPPRFMRRIGPRIKLLKVVWPSRGPCASTPCTRQAACEAIRHWSGTSPTRPTGRSQRSPISPPAFWDGPRSTILTSSSTRTAASTARVTHARRRDRPFASAAGPELVFTRPQSSAMRCSIRQQKRCQRAEPLCASITTSDSLFWAPTSSPPRQSWTVRWTVHDAQAEAEPYRTPFATGMVLASCPAILE